MRLIFTSYISTPEFKDPIAWLRRIDGYTGILEALAREHEVISIERIDHEGNFEIKGVHYFFYRLKNGRTLFPIKMHRMIRRWSPDVIFVNGFVFPLQLIQLRLQVGSQSKIIVLHRAEKPFTGWRKYLQVLADRCVNHYFFVSSEFGLDWKRAGIIANQKKICEIMQASSSFRAINRQHAREILKLHDEIIFLWVGRLDANKDPVTVIKAFINFAAANPQARLYMIYRENGLADEILSIIKNNSVAQLAIKLVGAVAHEKLGVWYSATDFFISGSHYEGSGVAVIEAMSCGCVPVLTDIISFRKLTAHGQYGILYKAGNAQDLQSKLGEVMQMDLEREKERVYHHFQREYSYEAIAKKIESIIGKGVADRKPAYANA
jgi:glycosyltransferase involved in cell wall biosynthesis